MSMEQSNWCYTEFSAVTLGDDRLNRRFLTVAGDLLANPTAPIVEATDSWREAKAAYRLFDNAKLSDKHIRELHQTQTIKRLEQSKDTVFFAIQDTTTLNYTHHPKKSGMGKIHKAKGFSQALKGCFLHNTLLITNSGLPLGLLDQKIYQHESGKAKNSKQRPITEKESYRWLEALEKTQALCEEKPVITICDRESDIYEFFVHAEQINAKVLVRASKDRIVFGSKHTSHETLWSYMKKQAVACTLKIEVPAKRGRAKREAQLEVRYSELDFNPPQRLSNAQVEKLPKLKLNAIWFYENTDHEERLEWMLLTNVEINNTEDAVRVGQWYKLRWQIECYHRVLKSGCNVENCRLESYERLKRYLALKGIIAYRLFYLTLLNRIKPSLCCEKVLAPHEWKALYCHVNKTSEVPKRPPTVHEAIRMLARLGGFLGRKNDGEPGMTPIWRGWHKLTELSELWLVISGDTYG